MKTRVFLQPPQTVRLTRTLRNRCLGLFELLFNCAFLGVTPEVQRGHSMTVRLLTRRHVFLVCYKGQKAASFPQEGHKKDMPSIIAAVDGFGFAPLLLVPSVGALAAGAHSHCTPIS